MCECRCNILVNVIKNKACTFIRTLVCTFYLRWAFLSHSQQPNGNVAIMACDTEAR